MQNYTPRPLRSFIFDQIRANGIIYFMSNYSDCIAHCSNQKRLHHAMNCPIEQAKTACYVDALWRAGDIK